MKELFQDGPMRNPCQCHETREAKSQTAVYQLLANIFTYAQSGRLMSRYNTE
jgi:hypothetical protein